MEGQDAPIAPEATPNEPVAPAAPAPNEAPASPTPEAPAAQPQATPTPAVPTTPGGVPKGTAPGDIDTDALLDALEAEAKAEEEAAAAQPPADPVEPPASPEPPVTPPAEEPKPGEEPAAAVLPDEPIDINNVETYFTTPEVPEYGIKPVGELRDPEPGESANDYFKQVTMPAIVQTVQNVAGFAQRNNDLSEQHATQAQEKQFAERMEGWGKEIESLNTRGIIKDIEKDANGAILPDSAGGKVVGDVLKFMKTYNEDPKNKDSQITSFAHGYVTWKNESDTAAAAAARGEKQQTRAEKARALSGGGNGRKGAPKAPTHVVRGQKATDLDFDELLG